MAAVESKNSSLIFASRIAAVWTFGYGLYRLYYAAGGTLGMLGTPMSQEQFLFINRIAAGLLLIFAVLPLALLGKWKTGRAHPFLVGLCLLIAVLCISHALIGILERISSLSGLLTIDYPFWRTIDRRQTDLRDLFFNEPWFMVEGLLWAAIGWTGALHDSPRRSLWIASAGVAVVSIVAMGLLSAFAVIPKMTFG